MKWNVGSKIALGFGTALMVFVIVGSTSWRNIQQQSEDARWVAHTHEVITTLAQLLGAIQEAESDERGFIITGDETYLAPFEAAVAETEQRRTHLMELVSDNPTQLARAQTLASLLSQRTNFLDQA